MPKSELEEREKQKMPSRGTEAEEVFDGLLQKLATPVFCFGASIVFDGEPTLYQALPNAGAVSEDVGHDTEIFAAKHVAQFHFFCTAQQ